MKILLFDIDGTLLLSGGAGSRGMTRAFAKLYGIENGLRGITLSGMTDPIIFRRTCEKAGVRFSQMAHAQFKTLYLQYLEEEIQRPNPEKRLLPGVLQLLQRLASVPEVYLGLLTGNYRAGARVKLSHFGLDEYFRFGAFGDDHEDRNQLLPFALKRFHEQFRISPNGEIIWVIGDTPNDVACARPYGAKTVAVSTGDYDENILQQANPDVLLRDLKDIDRFLKAIQN